MTGNELAENVNVAARSLVNNEAAQTSSVVGWSVEDLFGSGVDPSVMRIGDLVGLCLHVGDGDLFGPDLIGGGLGNSEDDGLSVFN